MKILLAKIVPSRHLRRLTTRSGLLAMVAVVSIAGVAAAAAGAPLGVIGDGLGADDPELVDVVGEDGAEHEGEDGAEGEGEDGVEPEGQDATEPQDEDETEGEDDEQKLASLVEEPGEEDSGENVVSEAAQSDCFRKSKGHGTSDVGGEDAEAAGGAVEESVAAEGDEGCAVFEVDFSNHGQYVAAVAHQRNADKWDAKCKALVEDADPKADRCLAKAQKLRDKSPAKAAERAEEHAEEKANKADRKAMKADRKAQKSQAKAKGND